ncbi:hypothetical protein CR513_25763, partial [Mucuna pruriens]
MWKHKRGSRWKNNSNKHTKEIKDKTQVVCYEFKKPGQFISECPNLEKVLATHDKRKSMFQDLRPKKEVRLPLKKLGHASLRLISKLKKHNLMRGLSSLVYKVDLLCDYYVMPIKRKNKLETWVMFLTHKDESFKVFSIFYKCIQNEKGINIISIISDHGEEFENENFQQFCEEHGVHYNFSYPITPQHNGVVERKNRFLQEMTRTIIYIRPILKKTLYNSRTLKVEESIHVKFNDSKHDKELLELIEPFVELNIEDSYTVSKESLLDDEPKIDKVETSSRNWQMKTYHHEQQILGNIKDRVKTQLAFKDQAQMALLSKFEPKNVEEALLDDRWILAMQEELNQF